MKWNSCSCCKEKTAMLFSITLYSQHCSPCKQAELWICDICLTRSDIDPDRLASVIHEPFPSIPVVISSYRGQ